MGHRVLRTDTDVYFAEDPYPILSGPLFGQYAMVVQQDFGGPLGGRPTCKPSNGGGPGGSCGLHKGTPLLDIGPVYVFTRTLTLSPIPTPTLSLTPTRHVPAQHRAGLRAL